MTRFIMTGPYPVHCLKHICLKVSIAYAIFFTGCNQGEDRVPVAQTTGRLVWPNNETMGLLVVFHPTDSSAPKTPVQPTGVIQKDGSFTVTCYDTSDGAPAGDYVVTIREAPRAEDAPKPKLPPAKYLKKETSPLKATIQKGTRNELPPLEIGA